MTLKAAVDRLGTWTVTGVKTPYALNNQPNAVNYTSLPALVILLPDEGSGKPFDLGLSQAAAGFELSHVLLLASGVSGSYYGARLYAALDLIDNYFIKVKTDWTLNGNLLEPLVIDRVEFKTLKLGGNLYNGVEFHHRWVLNL